MKVTEVQVGGKYYLDGMELTYEGRCIPQWGSRLIFRVIKCVPGCTDNHERGTTTLRLSGRQMRRMRSLD